MHKLLAIQGISASGKNFLMEQVMKNRVLTTTSRDPREGEKEGCDYYYRPKDECLTMVARGEFFEDNEYEGNKHFYGTTRTEMESKLGRGPAFIILDYKGVQKFKTLYPNSASIFIYSDRAEIEQRLAARGLDDGNRLAIYDKEVSEGLKCDYIIKNRNGHSAKAVEMLKKIIEIEC